MIDTITAFISIDADGDEALCGFQVPSGPIPMVAADSARLDSLFPLARQLAAAAGIKIEVVRFSARTLLTVIEPDG